MKSKKKLLIAGLGIAIAAAFVTWFIVRPSQSSWPDFLMDKPDAPRYNTEVVDRDFGYRTGNHVPVKLYFKLLPGMELMTEQMVINGDFEVVSKTEHREQKGADTLVRVDLVLQAFVLKPKLEAKPTIAYRSTAGGDPKKLDLLAIEVYTSQTFDGRKGKHPKEGNLTKIDDGHLWITSAFVLVGSIGVLLAVGKLVRDHMPRLIGATKLPVGDFPPGWTPVQEAWFAITSGDHSKTAFTRVAELIRTYFGVQSLTVVELRESTLPTKEPLAQFLTVCEAALWTDCAVDEKDIANAGAAMQTIENGLK